MTDHQSRRDFLKFGVAAAVACAAGTNAAAADGKADLILHNGRIATLEEWLGAGEKDTKKLSGHFKLIQTSCKDCHAKYRD